MLFNLKFLLELNICFFIESFLMQNPIKEQVLDLSYKAY